MTQTHQAVNPSGEKMPEHLSTTKTAKTKKGDA